MKFEIIDKTIRAPTDIDIVIGKEFHITVNGEPALIKNYKYNEDLHQLIEIYTRLSLDLFSYILNVRHLEYYFDSLGCDCCTEWGYEYIIDIKHEGQTYELSGSSSNEEFAIQQAISECALEIGKDSITFYCD